jgi:peptidoglycan/xylan/chitin deacetylase (PgdA/CDA1 family)
MSGDCNGADPAAYRGSTVKEKAGASSRTPDGVIYIDNYSKIYRQVKENFADEFTHMMLPTQIKKTLLSSHRMLASALLALTNEQGALLCFLFHSLFESGEEVRSGVLDPQQGVTVEMFRAFLGHFHEQGYGFVSPRQILEGLPPSGKYILLTFDDGYCNNARALPAMEEFDAPAVFFISSEHVREGKAFWWDAAYREGRKRGKSEAEIGGAVAGYKRRKTEEVERELKREFGEGALHPVGDLDRPFTPGELRAFAEHRLVSMGNHTKNHAILTNYSLAEAREQIQGGQDAIQEMTGKMPDMISYPNGNSSLEIQRAAREAGLRLGVVVRRGKNRLPLKTRRTDAMAMKRFTLWGDRGITAQCRVSRANVSFYGLIEGLRARAAAASW